MSEEKRKCPGCAEEIPANATVCEYCGEKFNSFLETEQTMEKPELYNPKAAANWSLLFTPIFGAYVIKSNWKMLGQEQREKRSRIWLITLSVIYIVAMFFLDESVAGLYLLPLAAWYFVECRSQIKYLTENRIDYQKKKWKPLIQKAACVWAAAMVLCFIILALCGGGGPTLDYSSPGAYRQSCKEIIEYLGKEFKDKYKGKNPDDLTEKEKKEIAQVMVLGVFLDYEHDNNLKKTIDGMSAHELLKFVNENYWIDPLGQLHEVE